MKCIQVYMCSRMLSEVLHAYLDITQSFRPDRAAVMITDLGRTDFDGFQKLARSGVGYGRG